MFLFFSVCAEGAPHSVGPPAARMAIGSHNSQRDAVSDKDRENLIGRGPHRQEEFVICVKRRKTSAYIHTYFSVLTKLNN